MLKYALVACSAIAIGVLPAVAQQKKDQKKEEKKVEQKKAPARPVATGPKERFQCKVGPYEKQTRLVMETIKQKPVYLAYWSSNGPFHCSFETWPGDGRARWNDSSAGTVINLISGTMLIERNADKYILHAREIDRMPYCGTFGSINGVLTVPTRKGTECDWRDTTPQDAGQLRPDARTGEESAKPGADEGSKPPADAGGPPASSRD